MFICVRLAVVGYQLLFDVTAWINILKFDILVTL